MSESLIPYSPEDSYARVILTGLINTIVLAAVSLLLATLLGVIGGLLSVGPSPAGRVLATSYVELFRNLPKILVLLVFFVVAVNGLPPVRESISLGPVQISNRALYLPALEWDPLLWAPILAIALAAVLALAWRRWATGHFARTGQLVPIAPIALGLLIGLPWFAVMLFQVPVIPSLPELRGFDFTGGLRLSLQFVVMAAMLGLYHGAQITEVVRGGIQSVPSGQFEAASALGINRRRTMRLVVLPQVLRIVIPPINNQYVNLIKNTSIGIAVGYSDLMSVVGTIINQTFRPLEMMLVTMGLYLALCLAVTSLLNRWNAVLRRREGKL
ncbi:ABC transporter permease subunit [Bauldia sp.]|uniref:ABC transporter permease subunit n=1 Tax=Bauldia sp. TaxID=2575872 RepID=UPI003BA9A1F7